MFPPHLLPTSAAPEPTPAEDFLWVPNALYAIPPRAGSERPWPRTEVWIAAGQYHPEDPEDPVVFELRLFGPRKEHGELVLMTVCLGTVYEMLW